MKPKSSSLLFLWPSVFLLALTVGSVSQAALLRSLNDKQTLEVPIAQQGLTRITVKNDRILNVFGTRDEYVLEADEDQGQIFIRPIDAGPFASSQTSPKPIHITLTTEKGHTQDLRLIPKNQAPEALILEEKELGPGLGKEKYAQTSYAREDIENLLQACQEDRIPLGYKAISRGIRTNDPRNPYRLVREIRSEKYESKDTSPSYRPIAQGLRGLTYEVHNTSLLPLILSERSFAESCSIKTSDIIAILMPQKTLQPGEGAYVYVVAQYVGL